jgi:hypothetical protein
VDRDEESKGDRTTTAERVVGEACDNPAFVSEVSAGFTQLKKDLLELWAIKVAELKLSLLQKVFLVAAGLLGLAFAMALVGVSVFFIFGGIAAGLSQALSSPWLGSLLTGVLGIALVAGALLISKRILQRSAVKAADVKKEVKKHG